MKQKIIEKRLGVKEIGDRIIIGFKALVKTLDGESERYTLLSYIAGVMATLNTLGFNDKNIRDINDYVQNKLEEIADKECDCPNCRK